MRSKHSTSHRAAPVGVGKTVSSYRPITSQRSNLALCLVPLLLLGATCAGAAIEREVLRSNNSKFGHMTRSDACEIAGGVFTQILGSAPRDYDTSTQSAFSVRRRSVIREWSVLCSTPDGQYLLRINADTRRVYAINRMDDLTTASREDDALLADGEASEARLSHAEAEARARSYIGLIGIPTRYLTPISVHSQNAASVTPQVAEADWNFTFQNSDQQKRNHLVTISVRSRDGRLEHLWNPVFSL